MWILQYESSIPWITGIVNSLFAEGEDHRIVQGSRGDCYMIDVMDKYTEQELQTVGGRLKALLRWRGFRQKDLVDALGKSSGYISEVVNSRAPSENAKPKELDWASTAAAVKFLKTNANFVLGLSDYDGPMEELIHEPAPFYLHEESDELAKLCDAQPEVVRRQMLAVAQALVESVSGGGGTDWDERLGAAKASAELVLGKEDAAVVLDALERALHTVSTRQPRRQEISRRNELVSAGYGNGGY
jgi:transcriptional regulator with XRE-family HTH domain